MNPNPRLLLTALWLLLSPSLMAVTGDADNDGLRDEVETGTGIYVSASNTGTNPALADSDGDSLPDGMEVNLGTLPTSSASKLKRPNIIFIIADDLAYGDIGCFWQNQRTGIWKFTTPGLDAMAAEGTKMTHYYSGAPICAPSRASLLLGQHQGNALIRDAELDKALPDNHNVASMLKSAGYRTVHVGKAGIAGTLTNPLLSSQSLVAHPLKRGFDRFFGYLRHNDGWEHYPRNGTAPNLAVIHNDYQPVTDAYQDLFTGDAWTAFAKKTIIEETQQHPDRPFFLYLAYDTPHFDGCTAPTKTYPANKGLNGGIQWQGAPAYASTAVNDPARVNNLANADPSCNPTWFTGAKQYVSMIKRLDDSVADILQTLKDLAIDDNTLVIITSDNGSSDKFCGAAVFQSSAGFEGAKFDIWEGGIRVPAIAWWPGRIPSTNQLSNIRDVTLPCASYDWMPTFAELAKINSPAVSDGVSLVPALTAQGQQKEHDFLFFDTLYGGNTSRYSDFPNHGGESRFQMQSIRVGDMTGVRVNIQTPTAPFRIYNVVTDPKQSIDLAASRPDLQAKMQEIAVGARRRGNGLWTRVYDGARIPAVIPASTTPGLATKAYEGYWGWLPDFKALQPVQTGISSQPSTSQLSRTTDAGVSFEGYFYAPTDGNYTFQIVSDGSACLWVHDGLSIDNDFIRIPARSSDSTNLAKGLHPIRLFYHQQNATAGLTLKYSGPGISLQTIPASAFSCDGPPAVFQLQPDRTVARRNSQDLIDVLANDTANYPLSLNAAGPASKGTLSLTTGKVLFQPANNFVGSDTFSYSVSGGGGTATSVVNASVLFDDETWIPFDEGAGTSVKAVSPISAITGILTGTPTPDGSWSNGKFNSSLTFDGIDDEVEFSGLVLPLGSSPRTFSCWLKTSATTSNEIQTLFSYGSQASGGLFAVRVHNVPGIAGNFPARLEVFNGTVIGTKPLNDGLWHHLAVVLADTNGDSSINVSEAQIFVDGMPDAITYTSPRLINTGGVLVPCVGGSNHATNHNFTGQIDDIRMFSKALSTEEILDLHSTPVGVVVIPPDPNVDTDGDGASDKDELIAGTDPSDVGSVFKIKSTTPSSEGLIIRWSAIAGKTYTVEDSTNLADWIPVPNIAPITPGAAIPNASVVVPPTSQHTRFIRISVK